MFTMTTKESNFRIISSIFYSYILNNPICRSFMFPVISIMLLAKYTEIIGAEQTEKLSLMIQNGQRNMNIILKFSLVSILIVILVEIHSFIICKAGQLGYRVANRDVFKYFLDLDPQNFDKIGKGEIQNLVNRKSQAVQDMIDVFTLNFFPTFLTLLFSTYSVFNNIGLGVSILINLGVICYAFATIKITEWRNKMRKRLNTAQNKTSNIMIDSLYNYEAIYTYDNKTFEVEKYDKALKNVESNSTELARSMYLLNLTQKGIWCVMTVIIILKACYDGKMIRIEKFTYLISIIGIVMKSMDNLGFMYGKFKTALLNAKLTLIQYEIIKNNSLRTALRLNNELAVRNMSIKKGGKTIFENINFSIKKGEKVAIIGKNGIGKSTLLKALIGLNAYEGDVKIDDLNLSDLSDTSKKNIIAYVPQNAILFDDTVLNNIKYGNRKVYDEDVYAVSKKFGIHDSILRLEKGYFTEVGEQGKKLSGGERQKVLILRAILRGTSIILMDEPTSSLDKQSEMNIISEIVKMKDITVLSIVHNLDLLKAFDRVLVVKDRSNIEEINSNVPICFEDFESCDVKQIKFD